jgi:hypothetical protein
MHVPRQPCVGFSQNFVLQNFMKNCLNYQNLYLGKMTVVRILHENLRTILYASLV